MDIQYTKQTGQVEVITGCMFASKTEELIHRATRAKIAGKTVYGFKPKIDDRYSKTHICSHNGEKIDAINIKSDDNGYDKLKNVLNSDVDVVIIDEINFFDSDITPIVQDLADNGIRVILSGLDQTFRGEPFEPLPSLLAIADHVEKRKAICESCGDLATKTQRLINNEPAPYDAPTIDVGGDEKYEPRCRKCHQVPKNKNLSNKNIKSVQN